MHEAAQPRHSAPRVAGLPGDARLLDELQAALCSATGIDTPIMHATRVHGGSIAAAFRLQTQHGAWFLKLDASDRYPLFAAEADGLLALAACPAIRVPCLIAHGVGGSHAYLLLEHLEMRPLHAGLAADAAGRALAALHRQVGQQFGWPQDNFLGATTQHNGSLANWPEFFARRRLLPQLALAARHGYDGRLQADGARLAAALPSLFDDYQPMASLLHGDLWSGNAAFDADGRLCLFDPAVHYGDRECDLAMMALFGGFPSDMLTAYETAWPLAAGAELRRALYQLYHVLNHLNLFGDSYLAQAGRLSATLLASLH